MRLIDADEVHNLVQNSKKYMWYSPITSERKVTVSTDDVQFGVDKIPTIDAMPVAHGWWINSGGFDKCSVCDALETGRSNYCPWCGAKMDEDFKEE